MKQIQFFLLLISIMTKSNVFSLTNNNFEHFYNNKDSNAHNIIHLNSITSDNNTSSNRKSSEKPVVEEVVEEKLDENNMQIFINQSNNVYVMAKYGQTVSLPCVIFRQRLQDLINIHAIWYKLHERQRPLVLSIGTQQLRQDMRFRVKVNNIKLQTGANASLSNNNNNNNFDSDLYSNNDEDGLLDSGKSKQTYLVQNWQFEIRKLTYEDAGTYQCLLPLVNPIFKNITLQVIPDLVIEPKEGNFKVDEKIVIKCKATMKSNPKHSNNNNNKNSRHQMNQRHQRSTIHWYKDDEIIKVNHENNKRNKLDPDQSKQMQENNKKFEIETKNDNHDHYLNSVLTINDAKLDDSGRYRCIYENIQESVTIKVFNDYYEYNNFLKSNAMLNHFANHQTVIKLLLVSLSILVAYLF